MRMELSKPSFDNVLYIASNMRRWDHREIFATRWNDSVQELAADTIGAGSFGWVAGLERPIAVIGAAPIAPGVWSAYMFATDEFSRIRFSLTRHARRVMMEALTKVGAHRLECISMEGHEDAHKWLEYLGAHREGPLRKRGRSGEDFFMYAWVR